MTASETEKNNAPGSRAGRWKDCVFLVVLCFVIYNVNFQDIGFGDAWPTRVLPFSLIIDHTFHLDRWLEPYLHHNWGPGGIYFAVKTYDGHWLSAYPILLPLLVTPLYLFPSWWLVHHHVNPANGDVAMIAMTDIMEKLSVSLIAAVSVGLFYLVLRRVLPRHLSLGMSLLYGVASSTWSISSQSMWRQGVTELLFVILLGVLLAGPGTPRYALWVGTVLALNASNAPQYAVWGVLFFFYFLFRFPRKLWLYCLPFLVIGGANVAYFYYYTHHPLGPFQMPRIAQHPEQVVYKGWDGLAGLLVSPSRGLLIYIPWTVFALWGAARAWKRNSGGWERYVLVGIGLIYLAHVRLEWWWGGWCFGPRYLTDFLPFLTYFFALVWPDISRTRILKPTFAAAVIVALWVQVIGTCYFPKGEWDARPVDVYFRHSRLWDWRDTPITRSLASGRADPTLYYEFFVLMTYGDQSSAAAPPALETRRRP
jgi:hypothetical protein